MRLIQLSSVNVDVIADYILYGIVNDKMAMGNFPIELPSIRTIRFAGDTENLKNEPHVEVYLESFMKRLVDNSTRVSA